MTTETITAAGAKPAMNLFERYLTLWVALCIVVGIALGHLLPGLFQTVGRMEIAKVNLPVAVLIWLMIIPMLIKIDFGALIDAADLDHWLTDARSRIPYANQLCQLNLLGSHDTTRFLTLLDEDRALMRSALLIQFTYPGVPCVYYGDEIGMTGQNDPYNRACFDWDQAHWDQDLHGFIRDLAQLRREHVALRRGAYQTLIADGDLFGFARFDAQEQLLVLLNRSQTAVTGVTLDLGWLPASEIPHFEDLFSDTEHRVEAGRLQLDLDAKAHRLLHRGYSAANG